MDIEQVDPELELNRDGIKTIVDGFRGFTLLANQILGEEGVGNDDGLGNLAIPTGSWPQLRRFLKALQRIEKEVGTKVLMDAGQAVPKHAVLPPTIVDIYSALGALDIAYHMNHRKHGKPLFDPATGTMQEGIGHFAFTGKQGDSKVEIVCDSPYPCSHDQGVVSGMAQRFKPTAQVTHGNECRSRGGRSCTYSITWK